MATYYVRADGSATKANATGVAGQTAGSPAAAADAAKCCTIATLHATAMAAGDLVYMSSQGGAYAISLTVWPGAAGNPVTYRNITGESPVVTRTYAALNVTQGNVTFDGINFTGTNGADPVAQVTGTTANVIIKNCTITTTGAAGTGILASGNTTGLIIQNVVFAGAGTGNPIILSTGTHAGVTISGITIPAAMSTIKWVGTVGGTISAVTAPLGVDPICIQLLDGVDGVTVTGITGRGVSMSEAANVSISGCAITGRIYTSATYGASHHITVTNNTLTNTLSSAGIAFGVAGDNNITITHNRVYGCLDDGILTDQGVHDVEIAYNLVESNGDGSDSADGDGITCHTTDYNISIHHNLIRYNACSGVAMVNTTSGTIYNNVFYQNGNGATRPGGVTQTRANIYINTSGNNPTTGVGWTIKNNISMGGAPRELYLVGTATDVLDYNCWKPTSDAAFAIINGGATNISWTEYHVTNSREAHSINAEPGFTNAAGGVFTLASYLSPAVDAGADLDFTTDYAGNAIPGTDRDEATPDIGAYQMTAAQIAAQQLATDKAAVVAAKADIRKDTSILGTTGADRGTLDVNAEDTDDPAVAIRASGLMNGLLGV